MKKSCGYTVDMSLKSRGYHLDFKVKSAINGGFECNIFSDGKKVVIVTGKRVHRMGQGDKAGMFYKYHRCQFGDKTYLENFLKNEALMSNPELLEGEYGEMFRRLIHKIRSYGNMDTDSKEYGKLMNPCAGTGEKVYFLSKHKKFRSPGQCHNQRSRRTI